MKIQYLLPGLALAAVGFLMLFALLGSVSALAKSKQLSAMSALASGNAGGTKRVLFFVAMAAMLFGACGTFGAIAKSDGERLDACLAYCRDHGAGAGHLGPAEVKDPRNPGAFCKCEHPEQAPEVPADSLKF